MNCKRTMCVRFDRCTCDEPLVDTKRQLCDVAIIAAQGLGRIEDQEQGTLAEANILIARLIAERNILIAGIGELTEAIASICETSDQNRDDAIDAKNENRKLLKELAALKAKYRK